MNKNPRPLNQSSASRKLRIAVVQQNGNPGKYRANLATALDFATQALAEHADVILFHEELLVGYVPNLKELAEPVDGPATQAFQQLLRGTAALIIYGLTERAGDHYFISAPVVSAAGVITTYRKTHLWWHSEGLRHEPTHYQPGNELITFTAKGHRCGLMICYDGDFPEMTRAYADRGCSVVCWMNNRESRGPAEVKELAYRNSMVMATACCCGVNEMRRICPGGSNITDATGEPLAEIWDREGIIVATVDPDQALKLRQENPWYIGRRPELYGVPEQGRPLRLKRPKSRGK